MKMIIDLFQSFKPSQKNLKNIVLGQMISFIDETTILGPNMSGFRKGHSAMTALIAISDDLISSMHIVNYLSFYQFLIIILL